MDALSNVKFVAEKKLISQYFDEIAQDTGMIVFGVNDTIRALETGALEKLIVFEDLEHRRYEIRNPVKEETKTHVLNKV